MKRVPRCERRRSPRTCTARCRYLPRDPATAALSGAAFIRRGPSALVLERVREAKVVDGLSLRSFLKMLAPQSDQVKPHTQSAKLLELKLLSLPKKESVLTIEYQEKIVLWRTLCHPYLRTIKSDSISL